MSKEALDEISVLSAIYCEQDEFELLEESGEYHWKYFSLFWTHFETYNDSSKSYYSCCVYKNSE